MPRHVLIVIPVLFAFLTGCATVGTGSDVLQARSICKAPEDDSQSPIVRLYGSGRSDGFVRGHSLLADEAGNLTLAGITQGLGSYAGNSDLLLMKIQSSREVSWARAFGGPQVDIGIVLDGTTDGGHIQGGVSRGHLHTGMAFVVSGSDTQRLLLLKTDSNGNYEWHKLYLTQVDETDRSSDLFSVLNATDGGYFLGGSLAMNPTGPGGPSGLWSDALLAKTDRDGNALWGRSYGKSGPDEIFAMVSSGDGGLLLAGTISTSGDRSAFDALLMKVDDEGNPQWARSIGGSGNNSAKSSALTADGAFVVAAETDAFGAGGRDILLIKTDRTGKLAWARTIGSIGDEEPSMVIETTDGGLLLAGYTSTEAGGRDALILKTNGKGELKWVRTFGEAGDDYASSAVEVSANQYVIAGTTESHGARGHDIFVLQLRDPHSVSPCIKSIQMSQTTPEIQVSDIELVGGKVELLYQSDSLRKQRDITNHQGM